MIAPHCDTMDGPVVTAARRALEEERVNLMLPWVGEEEEELGQAFEGACRIRKVGGEAAELADLWFSTLQCVFTEKAKGPQTRA
nr:DUF6448 family protein [Candidatus Solincola tengchongensis]